MGIVFKLFWTQFKVRWGLSIIKYNYKNKRKDFFKAIGLILVFLFAMTEVLGGYTFLIYKVYGVAKAINHPEIIISFSFLVSQVMTLIFGLFFILGLIFFAKDSEFLASLPLPQWKVFTSKFMQVYVSELMVSAAILAPPVIIYGVFGNENILFYLRAIVIFLFVPAIPLTISALLALLLMRFVGRTRNRDMVSIILGFVFIIGIITGQNLLTTRLAHSDIGNVMQNLLSSGDALIKTIGAYFPPSIWATVSVARSGLDSLYNILLFVLVSCVAIFIVVALSSKVYYSGALAQIESVKKKKTSGIKYTKSAGSPIFAIFKREWLVILRSPIYALNSLVGIIIPPLLLLLMKFGPLSDDPEIMTFLKTMNGENMIYVIWGLTVASTLFAAVNPAAATIMSREGQTLWLTKTIPVSPKEQVRAKFLAGYSIAFLTLFITAVVGSFSFGLSPVITFSVIVFAIIISVTLTSVNVMIDISRPKLVWSNEQEAIKQNFNAFLGMLAGYLVLGMLIGMGFLLKHFNISPETITFAVMLTSVVFAVISYLGMLRISEWAYARLDN